MHDAAPCAHGTEVGVTFSVVGRCGVGVELTGPVWPLNAAEATAGVASAGKKMFGGVLLSHHLSGAVPSALAGLTSGFGMGPGVSLSLWPP